MTEPQVDLGWKHAGIRLVEALRWPAAAIAIAVIFRGPLGALIDSATAALR